MIRDLVSVGEELYEKIKSGQVEKIEVHGYNNYTYIYELVKIERNGRTYNYERND